MREKAIKLTALLLGLMLLANGLYQLLAPAEWYQAIPGVSGSGPLNQHFVRDIGIIYSICGAGSILGAFLPQHRIALWWAPTVWLIGHALFHIWEAVVGHSSHGALLRDFVGVSLPALLFIAMLWLDRQEIQENSQPK